MGLGIRLSRPGTLPKPQLRLKFEPRPHQKDGGPEPPVDWFDIDWDVGRRKAAAHLARLKEGDKVPSSPKADDQKKTIDPPNENQEKEGHEAISPLTANTPIEPLSPSKPLNFQELDSQAGRNLRDPGVMDSFLDMIMKDDAIRASFLLKAKNSNLNFGSPNPSAKGEETKDDEDVEARKLFPSPYKSKTSSGRSGDGDNALSNAIIPLLSKTKNDIRLKELTIAGITQWGDAAENYEKQYRQDWNRHEIDRTTCRAINFRWRLPVYRQFLPEALHGEDPPADNSWKDPAVISTVELIRFLKKTVDVGQGKSNLNEGFAELLEYIKGHSLPMKKKIDLQRNRGLQHSYRGNERP